MLVYAPGKLRRASAATPSCDVRTQLQITCLGAVVFCSDEHGQGLAANAHGKSCSPGLHTPGVIVRWDPCP